MGQRAQPDVYLRIAIGTAVVCSVGAALYVIAGREPSRAASSLIYYLCPALAALIWLQHDSHRTHVGDVHDFGFFAWIAWPVVIPWYAFKSRGKAGWRLLLWLLALILSPYLAVICAMLIRSAFS